MTHGQVAFLLGKYVAIHSIELCAGIGMLGEGFAAALEYLGIKHRTVCYVEREAAAASQLVTLMEAGALAPAPIWSDLLTFDGGKWRRKVDCVIAGFPCQDISIAGRRAGLDGKRSGLFFGILDLADACGAWILALENVSAIATATASVMDEEEGELDERAAARVVGELADRGWSAEWITLRASDVGSSHGRNRWFCVAWRVGHTGLQHLDLQQWADGAKHPGAGGALDDAGCVQWRTGHEQDRPGSPEACRHEAHDRATHRSCNVAHAERAERRPEHIGGTGGIVRNDRGRREANCGPGVADPALAISQGDGWHEGWTEPGREQGRLDVAVGGSAVADASEPRLPHAEQPGEPGEPGEPEAYGRRAASELHRAPLFAPGPADPIWENLIGASRVGAWERAVADDEAGACPWAPATKPGVRMLVDGMAIVVDESRNHQLRQVGNGVVPLQAATAFVMLLRRAGIVKTKPVPMVARDEMFAVSY